MADVTKFSHEERAAVAMAETLSGCFARLNMMTPTEIDMVLALLESYGQPDDHEKRAWLYLCTAVLHCRQDCNGKFIPPEGS